MTTDQHRKDSFRVAQATKCAQCRTPLNRSEIARKAQWCTRCADPDGYSDRLAVRQRELMAQRRQEIIVYANGQPDLFEDDEREEGQG